MRFDAFRCGILVVAISAVFLHTANAGLPLTTAFTYQGQLKLGGLPVSETCDFAFRLFNAESTPPGSQVGPTLRFDGVNKNPPPIAVVNGLFDVALDFGGNVFTGDARWLQISVCCASPCAPGFTTLNPRQLITLTPYAQHALSAGATSWNNLTDIPAGFADGVDNPSSGSCSVGQVVTGFNATGMILCALDQDTTLSEAEVESFVVNGPLNLAAGTTLNGDEVSTGPHTTSLPWNAISNIPAGFADGIDDTGGDGHSLDAADGAPVDAVFVDNDGNVGIATTTPAAQLEIRKTAGAPADTIRLDSEPDENPRIAFAVGGQRAAAIRLDDADQDQLKLTIFDSFGGLAIDALTIATNGNVGIQETDPQTLLAINDGMGNAVGITQNQRADSSAMELTTADSLGNQATRVLLRGAENNADIEFYRGMSGFELLSMTIDGATGSVGIGTTTPAAKLHAVGFGNAIRGVSTTSAAGSFGVKGEGVRFGVEGVATGGAGLSSFGVCGEAKNEDGYAGYFRNVVAGINPGGIAVFAESSSRSKDRATLRVNNISGDGAAAYFTASSSLSTVYIYQENRFLGQSGGVLRLRNGGEDADGTGGGHFIEAINDDESDVQFRVLTDGEVQSDVGFTTPAADFAEMLPAGADDLAPGDVLALDSTGKLIRTTKPYQPTVVGVYSTKPGFLGGKPLDGAIKGTIPLAMIGIVPVKVSAENGPIQPGDMLVASSIAGHAMRAGDKPPIGTVIGKALQPLTKQRGVIRLLLILQ